MTWTLFIFTSISFFLEVQMIDPVQKIKSTNDPSNSWRGPWGGFLKKKTIMM